MKVTSPLNTASTVLVVFLFLSWLPVSVGQQGEEAPLSTSDKMIWVPASNSTALCNDFTRAGFFIRQNTTSNNWVVFLEGGGLCYNTDTCNRRFFVSMVSATFHSTVRQDAQLLSLLCHTYVGMRVTLCHGQGYVTYAVTKQMAVCTQEGAHAHPFQTEKLINNN